MNRLATVATRRIPRDGIAPAYIHHPSFDAANATKQFAPAELLARNPASEAAYMPDEETREHSRAMHFAASRIHAARNHSVRSRWQHDYFQLRDRIVLGNRKLIYRAVRRRVHESRTDDTIGDCHIVLIQVVAAFNPWLDIRFSTYAYTCLVRALSRMSQRLASDRLAAALSISALPDGEPMGESARERSASGTLCLEAFLRDDHPLLTAREKSVLAHRFAMAGRPECGTLEGVGRKIGLSKERVRQVQATALGKLRKALTC